MVDLQASLESTPTWAVAGVCFILILVALLIEHGFHLLNLFLKRRRRKTLIQALYHIKAELRNLGFMSLLLTVAQQPMSKICIPKSLGDTFLPCKEHEPLDSFTEEKSCQEKGKISLISAEGTQQLQMLLIALAVFHILSCILTLGFGEVKMRKWHSWEEETSTLEYQLSNDPRRLKLARQTSFGRRHLKSWSGNHLLLWLVCFFRQFTNSVTKADYFALRHGFIAVHFANDFKFDFRKFLQRSLDNDFVVVVRISRWIGLYAVLFIFFNAHGFYSHYWVPFIPLMILLVVGTKLQIIITTMCLSSSHQVTVVPGTVRVEPDNNYFWFRKPQLILHIIQFILIQNSFQLAFFTWSWFNFGLKSCFHREEEDFVLSIGIGILVQSMCSYITLPLYALVTQMGSSMKEAIFTDNIIRGIQNWKRTAKKNLAKKKSAPSSPSSLTSQTDEATPRVSTSQRDKSSQRSTSRFSTSQRDKSSQRSTPRVSTSQRNEATSSKSTQRVQDFKFPSGRLELLEVQKVVEEIIQNGASNMPSDGEISFGLWRKQSSGQKK